MFPYEWPRAPGRRRDEGDGVEREPEGPVCAGAAASLLAALRSHYAPVLLNDDDLTITYVGGALDPADEFACEGDVDNSQSRRVRPTRSGVTELAQPDRTSARSCCCRPKTSRPIPRSAQSLVHSHRLRDAIGTRSISGSSCCSSSLRCQRTVYRRMSPHQVRCRRGRQFRGYFKVMARCMPMRACGMPPIFASGQKQSIT